MFSFVTLATASWLALSGAAFPPAAFPAAARAGIAPPPLIGVVRDSAGAPIAEVHVIIAALNRSTTTNDSGEFTFVGLPPGAHHVTALMIGRTPGHADVDIPEAGPAVHVTIIMGTARSVRLNVVQVTATPTGTDPRDVAQSATEVSGQELARGLTTSVAGTLANEPGIAVRFNGPAAAPVIRGLSGERVLVLQDGQRAGDLAATSPDHAVSVDPLTAQRIEIVRGPASLLYGNNALGGVVNVISNELPSDIPSHVDGYVNSQAESATPGGGLSAGVTAPLSSRTALVVRGGGRWADDLRMGGAGILRNSFQRNATGSAGLARAGDRVSGGVLGRAYLFEYGLPSADDAGLSIRGRRYESVARLETATGFGPLSSARLGGTAQWYSHDEIEPNGDVGTRFDLRTQTVDLLGRTQFGRVSGALGASGLFRQYAATGEEALTPGATSNGIGAFLFQEVPLRRSDDPDARLPRLQGGARYDFYGISSRAGDPKFGPARTLRYGHVSGSLGINLPVTSELTLAASVARAFRAPTVEELFSNGLHAANGTYDVGNPDLEVETNQGADAIVRYTSSRLSAEVSAYASTIVDFIATNIVGDTTILDEESGAASIMPLNRFRQADARMRGLEGRAEFEVRRAFVLGVVGDLVRGVFTDGAPLPFLPPARLGALARYDDGRWAVSTEYRHGFAQNRVPATVVPGDPAGVATAAYDLVNLSAGYSFRARGYISSVLLRADNVLDERYRDAASRIKSFAWNPGRNLSVVYRTMF